MTIDTHVTYTRIGPVFLWWSEWCDRAVIGPKEGAWGGSDIFKCDSCPEWDSQEDEAIEGTQWAMRAHAQNHGYFVS